MILQHLRLRPAEEADLEALFTLERACFSNSWSRRSFEEELANEFSRLWVAGGAAVPVLGYLCYRMLVEEMDILRIGVLPSWRGRRVAYRLLGKGLHEGRASGARTAILEVRPSNASALNLYRKLGFLCSGKRKGYYSDNGESALILTKGLEKALQRKKKEENYEHESGYQWFWKNRKACLQSRFE